MSGVKNKIQKGEHSQTREQILIEPLLPSFAICKVENYSQVDPSAAFCFPQKTDEENSLVCLSDQVPSNTTESQDGWRAFRIKGQMDFSLIGILSGIAALLADKGIRIFVISTFNTDYILVRKEDFEKAAEVLQEAGYSIQETPVDRTLDYYEKNASSFSESTLHIDFTKTQQMFLNCLSPRAHILDFGCGAYHFRGKDRDHLRRDY